METTRIDSEPEKVDFAELARKAAQGFPDTTQTETPLEPKQSPENLTRARLLWTASQAPDKHREMRPEASESAEWNAKWCELAGALGKGTLAVIIGTRGGGKTQMGVCAIRQACKELRPALYAKALDFFLEVRGTYRKDSQKIEQDIIERYCDPELLVIDAIENRSDSPFENLLLNHLVDKRYDKNRDTILIGNYNEQEFAASMGPSIVDRIHECGIKILCNWKSFRRR